jgi:O-antigen ligase
MNVHPYSTHNFLRYFSLSLIFLLPCSLITGPSFTDILLSVISCLSLFYIVSHQLYKNMPKWFWIGLIFWAYLTVQGFIKGDFSLTFKTAVPWIRFLFLTFLITYLFKNNQKIIFNFEKLIILILILISLDTLYQFFMHKDLLGFPPHSADRLTGPFRHPRVGGFILTFCFPAFLSLKYFLKESPKAYRFLPYIMLFMFGLLIFLSGERMPSLLFLGGIILILFFIKDLRKVVLLTSLIAIILGGVAISFTPALKHRLTEQSFQELLVIKNNVYLKIWKSSLNIWKEDPFLGTGAGTFKNICPQEKYGSIEPVELHKRCGVHSHNYYVQLLTEGGLVGLSLFLLFLLALGRKIIQIKTHNQTHMGWVFSAILFLWPIAGMRGFFHTWPSTLLWMCVAMAMVSHEYGGEKK